MGSHNKKCKGPRLEWLFADRSYRYGKNLCRRVEPCGAFSEVEHLCAGIVRDLQLAKPNACLLVYYPRGTSGLNCHKDDEPAHASQQVITLCHGVGAALVLKDNRHQEVARERLEGGDFYVFRNQKSFYHGVDGVESTDAGRWAFTFRVFKPSSKTVRSIPTSRLLVSDSVASAKTCPVNAAGENAKGEFVSKAACDLIASPVSAACESVRSPVRSACSVRELPGRVVSCANLKDCCCNTSLVPPVVKSFVEPVAVKSSVPTAISCSVPINFQISISKLFGGGRPRKKVRYNFTSTNAGLVNNVNENEITPQNELTVIKGSIDQGDAIFLDSRGKQCTPISCVTITYFHKKDIDTWNLNDIDYILHIGDQLYRTSKNIIIKEKKY